MTADTALTYLRIGCCENNSQTLTDYTDFLSCFLAYFNMDGSIETQDKQTFGTFTFPVDIPLQPYDPWTLGYGKAPEGVYAKTVDRTYPLRDFRDQVFSPGYSIQRSREFLREYGFTAVKHRSSLQSPEAFQTVQLVNEVYYPEVVQLVKDVTGCSHVFITDSLVRKTGAETTSVDSSWQKSTSKQNESNETNPPTTSTMHKPSASPPTRLPHWDFNPLGARQTIRNWSKEIVSQANELGIKARENEISHPWSATLPQSEAAIQQLYDGPRYAAFSVWRPLKRVTCDPLAMAPMRTVETDPDIVAVPHKIKQPGVHGDWLRELATLKVKEDAVGASGFDDRTSKLEWYFLSDQNVDEMLLIKSFDSAALPGQATLTGEAAGVAHASPDVGDAAYGDARESVEVRVIAFW